MAANSPIPQPAWHVEPVEHILRSLSTTTAGLTQAEVKVRQEKYGPNRLPERGPTPLWLIVVRQFISPLIYILVAAAIVSAALGDFKDAGFISLVLLINGAIGAYQEAQAEKSSTALRKMLQIHAQVERDGEVREVLAEEVVPGDIIWLESGNRVAADIRLLSTQGLEINESLLTGESLAVDKDSEWQGEAAAALGDRRNMAFAGSMVSRGRGHGIVVATGSQTSIGELATDVLGDEGGKPPLLMRMEQFSHKVAVGTMVASIGIGLMNVLIWQRSIVDTFFLVVALAVSAIPEGLPVAMTIALAVATTRMAKRNVIVRRLAAVEGLGSCTLVATDKTGTLTCNELMVRELRLVDGTVFTVTGEGFTPNGEIQRNGSVVSPESNGDLESLLRAGLMCNEGDLHRRNGEWVWHGDAVDIALLSLGAKAGRQRERLLETSPEINQIPFESEHQFAATYHRETAGTVVYVKGAPERMLAMCGNTLTDDDRERLERMSLEMAEAGLRVIALGTAVLKQPLATGDAPPQPSGLTHLGYVGMIDPLRAGVKDAIRQCHQAGVAVTMITGDHRITAFAIARELGFAQTIDQVLTAAELEKLSQSELVEAVGRTRVFARVTPRQKLEIVHAARSAGHFVAVTGDGVNDAPAMRAANIGVAMGKSGTDVAREAAELVLSDDNFSSILNGIEEGRIAYDNIRKVIFLLVSMGAAELLMVLLTVISGLPVPLLPVQLLWLNLVTNGIQGVALAFEPGEGDSLRRRPRPPGEPIFNRLMIERMLIAVAVVGFGGFIVFDVALRLGWSEMAARNLLLLTMVLFENFHIGNCRSETKSAFTLSPFRSPVLFFGTLAAFTIHVLGMYLPFLQDILKTQPVDLPYWGVAIACALTIVPAIELHKWVWAKVYPDDVK